MSGLVFLASNSLGKFSRKKLGGKEYLVVPAVAAVDGVMNNELVTVDEFSRGVGSWNGRPFVLGHPKDDDGNHISVNSPDTLSERQIGTLFNARVDGQKFKVDVWIDEELAKQSKDGRRLLSNVMANKPVGLSTSYFRDSIGKGGAYNGCEYSSIARNIKPDHLAALLDEPGACTIDQGCGLTLNRQQATNVAQSARSPEYTSTSSGEWSAPSLEDYLAQYPGERPDGEQVSELPEEVRTWIADHSLLGDPDADNFRELSFFPVVSAEGALHERALRAVISGRGAQADIPEAAKDSAQSKARSLLEREFDFESNSMKQQIGQMIDWFKSNILSKENKRMKDKIEKLLKIDVIGQVFTEEQLGALEEKQLDSLLSLAQNDASEEAEDGVDENSEDEETSPASNKGADVPDVTGQLNDALSDVGGLEGLTHAFSEIAANQSSQKADLVTELAANSRCAFSEEDLQGMGLGTLRKLKKSLTKNSYVGQGSRLDLITSNDGEDLEFTPLKVPSIVEEN